MKRNASLDPMEALPGPFGPILGPKIQKLTKIQKSQKLAKSGPLSKSEPLGEESITVNPERLHWEPCVSPGGSLQRGAASSREWILDVEHAPKVSKSATAHMAMCK